MKTETDDYDKHDDRYDGPQPCEYCGSNDQVAFQEDPFMSVIRGDYSKHWICERCAYESAMDI